MIIDDTIVALQTLARAELPPLVAELRRVRMEGGTAWLCGNGGSFTTALHWACDLLKVAHVRTAVLGANGGVLTALSNDISYDDALAVEFDIKSRREDCLIALSCSGVSPNIQAALLTARFRLRPTVLVTSLACLESGADHTIRVASVDYGVIENVHLVIGHQVTNELASIH